MRRGFFCVCPPKWRFAPKGKRIHMYSDLSMLKNHLNVDFTEDDSYITALADAAEDYVEIYTNRPISEFLDETG